MQLLLDIQDLIYNFALLYLCMEVMLGDNIPFQKYDVFISRNVRHKDNLPYFSISDTSVANNTISQTTTVKVTYG